MLREDGSSPYVELDLDFETRQKIKRWKSQHVGYLHFNDSTRPGKVILVSISSRRSSWKANQHTNTMGPEMWAPGSHYVPFLKQYHVTCLRYQEKTQTHDSFWGRMSIHQEWERYINAGTYHVPSLFMQIIEDTPSVFFSEAMIGTPGVAGTGRLGNRWICLEIRCPKAQWLHKTFTKW